MRSLLKQPGAPALTIDYKMATTPGGWKIYDVAIDGVSLVTKYRDSFAEQVRTGGIDGLVKMLTDKNSQLASGENLCIFVFAGDVDNEVQGPAAAQQLDAEEERRRRWNLVPRELKRSIEWGHSNLGHPPLPRQRDCGGH